MQSNTVWRAESRKSEEGKTFFTLTPTLSPRGRGGFGSSGFGLGEGVLGAFACMGCCVFANKASFSTTGYAELCAGHGVEQDTTQNTALPLTLKAALFIIQPEQRQ